MDETQTETPTAAEAAPDVVVCGNRLRLFAESGPLVEAMVADIRSAKSRVWVESYIVADDAAGKAVAEALKERAAAGVECRMLYDTVGCLATPGAYFRDLQAAGIEVRAYGTFWSALRGWLRFFERFNRRNHRKLVVVDDRVAYFGGMNIVDQSGIETREDERARRLPPSSGWRDVHVRLEGPRHAEIARTMDIVWKESGDERHVRRPRWPIRQLRDDAPEAILFFDSAPTRNFRRPARILAPLMRRARRNITLSMAYFIPQGAVLKELLRARKRGVEVRVIVPGTSDVRMVQWASRHMYAKLLKRGIRIYERNDQMLHGKAMVIDDDWSVVGSCNLDPRSLRLNLEFLAVIRSRELAARLWKICEFERRRSSLVKVRHCENRSWWERFLQGFAWTFRRWL